MSEPLTYGTGTVDNGEREPISGRSAELLYGGGEVVDKDGNPQSAGNPSNLLDLVSILVVEFVGLLLFVFIGSLQTANHSVTSAALSHGITIAVLIIAFGHISGGHFNPAVTLGILVSGHMKIVHAAMYWVAQLLGGLAGAVIAWLIVPDYAGVVNPNTTAIHAGLVLPRDGIPIQATCCEAVLTYFLVVVVLTAAVDSQGYNVLAPLAIGLSITVDIYAGAKLSGACMNPARAFGPAIMGMFVDNWSVPWPITVIYFIGPAIGAVIAGLHYKLLLASGNARWLNRLARGR